MIDLETEKENLAKANRDISEGEDRIARQTELVERLRRSGHSVAQAERLLDTLHQTLQSWRDHRDEILRTITRLEMGRPEGSSRLLG
jgi:hypothetical protein